jgi:hypothetical protein
LALGFLKWFDNEQTEDSFAPLILVPVTMIRVPGRDGYLLRGRDDEIVENTSLREKLRTNFGMQIPEIPDGEDWKPSEYFDEVAEQISRLPKWQVNENAIGLGFFTFSKFMMWRDLDPSAWPNGMLLEHPLLNVLLGKEAGFESVPPLVPDEEPIDRHIDLSKCVHVVNADSSQAMVIEEARIGRNLVVQGPPGTGKSQTITNLIAAAVHAGKKVLFVAEKTAALEVVHDRLKKAGLSAVCLEIHSRKANKSEVRKSLEQSLRFAGGAKFDPGLPSKLADYRDKLNRWSSSIHKPIGQSGRSPFDVIGRQVKLRSDGISLLDSRLHDAAEWSADKLSSVEDAVTRATEMIGRLQTTPQSHPWFGTGVDLQSPFDLDLTAKLNAAGEKLSALSADIKRVFPLIGGTREPSFADTTAIINAFNSSLKYLKSIAPFWPIPSGPKRPRPLRARLKMGGGQLHTSPRLQRSLGPRRATVTPRR